MLFEALAMMFTFFFFFFPVQVLYWVYWQNTQTAIKVCYNKPSQCFLRISSLLICKCEFIAGFMKKSHPQLVGTWCVNLLYLWKSRWEVRQQPCLVDRWYTLTSTCVIILATTPQTNLSRPSSLAYWRKISSIHLLVCIIFLQYAGVRGKNNTQCYSITYVCL